MGYCVGLKLVTWFCFTENCANLLEDMDALVNNNFYRIGTFFMDPHDNFRLGYASESVISIHVLEQLNVVLRCPALQLLQVVHQSEGYRIARQGKPF